MPKTRYIIKFCCLNKPTQPTDPLELSVNTMVNGSLTLFTSLKVIMLFDDKNQSMPVLYVYTKQPSQVEMNDETSTVILNQDNNIYKIYFDSASAYAQFNENIKRIFNKHHREYYYSSGCLMYDGSILEKKSGVQRCGKGKHYYDKPTRKLKYEGDFEDCYYDGAGVFYNYDGNIKLVANNISKGIPTQKGMLIFTFNGVCQNMSINFNELWSKFNIDPADKKNITKIVSTDEFVLKVGEIYWLEKYPTIPLGQKIFTEKCSQDKFVELWTNQTTMLKKLQLQHKTIAQLTYFAFVVFIIIMLFICYLLF